MKKLITLVLCALTFIRFTAQIPEVFGPEYPKPTKEILALLSEELALKKAGDIDGLQQNRLDQIAAWQIVNPTVAAYFKPLPVIKDNYARVRGGSTENSGKTSQTEARWGNDVQLNAFFANAGVDMDVAQDGTIYTVSYVNNVRNGGSEDGIYIYKSTDNGITFTQWNYASLTEDIIKLKLSLMDAGTIKYLFVTALSTEGTLVNIRFKLAGAPLTYEIISIGIKSFDVDVDYDYEDDAQMYVVYIKKENDALYSARTPANGTGIGWVDQTPIGYAAQECAFTYGNGNTFLSFTGKVNGGHFFMSNSSFNSPGLWNTPITISDNSTYDSKSISLRAERKPFAQYRVVSLALRKPKGSNDAYKGWAAVINKTGVESDMNIFTSSTSVANLDSWSRKLNGNSNIKTSYINTGDRTFNVVNYNNGVWDTPKVVSDIPVLAFQGAGAIAGDKNNNNIASFLGATNYGLFFDSERVILGVEDPNKNAVAFYPNPVESSLTLTAKSKITGIIIYNMAGQEIKRFHPESPNLIINLSTLSKGTYILQVNINGLVENHKFIKN